MAVDESRCGLKTRIVWGLGLSPVLIFIVVAGGMILQMGALILGLIGMHEFYHAFSKERYGLHKIGYAFAIIYGVFINEIMANSHLLSLFMSSFMVVLLIYTVVNHKNSNALDGMTTFFGFFYVAFLISHIYLIREFQHGKELVWIAFISAFGCDTGAYFVGVTIGKHKLIPELSPKKTIEGSIGGIVFATVVSLMYGKILQQFGDFENVNIILICGLSAFFGSFLAQIGDLSASAMKRLSGIKDFGKVIPGHGGVLDRFDSVILTAPALYYVMLLLIEVGEVIP